MPITGGIAVTLSTKDKHLLPNFNQFQALDFMMFIIQQAAAYHSAIQLFHW